MKKLIFFISLSLLILVGCERNYERTIWVNPDVECCGVKDPLNNLEWLNSWYRSSYFNVIINYPTYQIVYIFNNDSTSEDFIVTRTFGNNYNNYFLLYTCNGDLIDFGTYNDYNYYYTNPNIQFQNSQIEGHQNIPVSKCEICSDFFEHHTLIDSIAFLWVK